MQQTLGNHRHYQIALWRWLGRNDRIEPDLANRSQDCFDVAVGDGSFYGKGLVAGDQFLSPQGAFERFDGLLAQTGEIGQSSFAHLLTVTIGLPQENGGVRTSVGYHLYMQDYNIPHNNALSIVY